MATFGKEAFRMRYVLVLAVGLLATTRSWADELSDARAALEKLGVRASTTGVALTKETELTKELGKSAAIKKNVLQAEKDLKSAEYQLDQFQRGLMQLKQQRVQLSAQLANINPGDI